MQGSVLSTVAKSEFSVFSCSLASFADCVPVCLNTFLRVKKWLRVRHAGKYFGRFDCKKCLRRQQIPFLQMKERSPAQFVKLGEELRDCIEHQEVWHWQREQYQQQRANLEPGQLLLVLDFTSFSLEPDTEESDQRMVYVQDFIIVMEFIEDGKLQTEYIDFICDSPDFNKHDYHFVLHAMQLFFRLLFH